MGEEVKPEETSPASEAIPGPPVEEEEKKKDANEEKKEAAEEEKSSAAEEEQPPPPPPPPPFILYIELHCVGCAKKIERSILKIRGVEGVVINMEENQVTIKGIVDPQAVCNKIKKKTKRMAKVISPAPAADGDSLPPIITSQVTGLTTVELIVNMHCEACADQLKKKILKMRGVQTTETDHKTGKVIVTGTMDGDKLVDYVYRRTKKQARIVPQPEPEPEPEPEKSSEKEAKKEDKPAEEDETDNKKDEKNGNGGEEAVAEDGKYLTVAAATVTAEEVAAAAEEEGMKRMMYNYYQPLYVIERIPPPQLFSDENPNACSIS